MKYLLPPLSPPPPPPTLHPVSTLLGCGCGCGCECGCECDMMWCDVAETFILDEIDSHPTIQQTSLSIKDLAGARAGEVEEDRRTKQMRLMTKFDNDDDDRRAFVYFSQLGCCSVCLCYAVLHCLIWLRLFAFCRLLEGTGKGRGRGRGRGRGSGGRTSMYVCISDWADTTPCSISFFPSCGWGWKQQLFVG